MDKAAGLETGKSPIGDVIGSDGKSRRRWQRWQSWANDGKDANPMEIPPGFRTMFPPRREQPVNYTAIPGRLYQTIRKQYRRYRKAPERWASARNILRPAPSSEKGVRAERRGREGEGGGGRGKRGERRDVASTKKGDSGRNWAISPISRLFSRFLQFLPFLHRNRSTALMIALDHFRLVPLIFDQSQ